MANWNEFAAAAPHIAGVFGRRHRATGNLCMLATLRRDGAPRISPMEPRIFEGQLALIGMPDTTKFRDLVRDPRFSLHTATVDTQVGDGDAKLSGRVRDVPDDALHERFATELYEESGMDLRGERFPHFFVADITEASAVEIVDGHLDITVWTGGTERVVRKH